MQLFNSNSLHKICTLAFVRAPYYRVPRSSVLPALVAQILVNLAVWVRAFVSERRMLNLLSPPERQKIYVLQIHRISGYLMSIPNQTYVTLPFSNI